METQLICRSEPFCKCVGHINEWDECDCFAGPDGLCVACEAKMVLIDFETGEDVIITTPEPNEIIEIDINTGEPVA